MALLHSKVITLRRKIFVKHSTAFSKSDLFEYFSKFGKIQEIDYKTDHKSKLARGFSYIVFYQDQDAVNAVDGCRMSDDTRFIECEVTKPSHVIRESLRTNGNKRHNYIRNEENFINHQQQTNQTLSGGKRFGQSETSSSLYAGGPEACLEWQNCDISLKRKESMTTCMDSFHRGPRSNAVSPKLLSALDHKLSEVGKLSVQVVDEQILLHTLKPTFKDYHVSFSSRTACFPTTYKLNYSRENTFRIY